MSLQSILNLSEDRAKQRYNLTEERIEEQLSGIRGLISFFRAYPDLFIDFLLKNYNPNNFKFYTYQRIYLRIAMRHRYVYATFPRAFSKSFLSMMTLIIRCVLYPGSDLSVSTGGKEQAASITIAKVDEICRLIPPLNNEINWDRGASKKSKDNVEYKFKNGSRLTILAANERSRGQRRTGLLLEECVSIEGDILNEILIPTTNVDRRLADGSRHPEEVVNKFQIYITTAGFKNSFAYAKLIELLVQSIIEPDTTMIMGGTYEVPVAEGLLNEDFVDTLKLSDTYNEDSFDREYRSIWSGDVENAFYSAEKFDKHRVLTVAEDAFTFKGSKTNVYYVIGVDVGRVGCTTEAVVTKCVYNPGTTVTTKNIVNIYTYEAEDFEQQAIKLKKLYYKYRAKMLVIDANGLGIGLIDFMTKTQVDPETGEELPPFGVAGGTSEDVMGPYKKIKGVGVEEDAMYLMKANAPINTEAYSYTQSQLLSGKIKFLVDEQVAKAKLLSTKLGQKMNMDRRNECLRPFVATTVLREQLLNLVEENEGMNIILKQSTKSIKKDKFSAFIYALYYIKKEEEKRNKRKRWSISDVMFFN